MKNSDGSLTGQLTTILFETAGVMMAVDAAHLMEVLEPLPVSPLPFVPPYLQGLVNVNGQIVPQVDLATFLRDDTAPAPANDNATLLVVHIDQVPLVLRVGQVFEPVDIALADIACCEQDLDQHWQPEKLAGQFTHKEQSILLLELSALQSVLGHRQSPLAPQQDQQSFLGKATARENHEQSKQDFLLIEQAGLTYACRLEDIQEVLDIQQYQALHRGEPWVLGVSLVHQLPVLLLHLSGLLGAQSAVAPTLADDALLHVLLVQGEGYVCGLVVDAIKGLYQATDDQLHEDKRSQRATLMLESQEMIEILPMDEVLSDDALARIRPHQPNLKERQQIQAIPTREYLRFFIDQDAYAIDIDAIRRIVGRRTVTPLLDQHAWVMGTVELEGHVLPVIDLNGQLGYSAAETTHNEFVVVDDGSDAWALAINETDDIINVPEPDIDALLDDDALIQAYARYNDDLVSVLNLPTLCGLNVQSARAGA